MPFIMILSILIFLFFIFLDIYLEGDGGIFLSGFLIGVILFFVLLMTCKVDLSKEEWIIEEQYEITYKPDFKKSKIFLDFVDNKAKLFMKKGETIKIINNFEIVNDDNKSIYTKYKLEKKGNFFKRSFSKTKTETFISTKFLKECSEKEKEKEKEK